MSYFIEAREKIEKEVAEAKQLNNYSKVTAEPTAKALIGFCDQNDEFAQAVVQGGSFIECIAHCTKGVGGSMSDIDFYGKAVQFYFPGAEIEFLMKIHMSKYETVGGNSDNIIDFNLTDFLS